MSTLVIASTLKTIQAKLIAPAATYQPVWTAHWSDHSTSGFDEDSDAGALNDTTAVVVVAAPTSGKRRIIKELRINNIDTAPITVELLYDNDGTSTRSQYAIVPVNGYMTLEGVFDENGSLQTSVPVVSASAISGAVAPNQGGTGIDTSASTGDLVVDSGTFSVNTRTGTGDSVHKQSPTIVTPTIASFTNANHDHSNSAGGGGLPGSSITSGTVAAARLGLMTGDSGSGGASGAVPAPASGDALKVLYGDGTWKKPGSYIIYPRTVSGADGTSITIPTFGANWSELELTVEGRSDVAAVLDNLILQLNTDTTVTNYYVQYALFTGTSPTVGQSMGATYAGFLIPVALLGATAPAGNASVKIRIMNYISTTQRRNIIWEAVAHSGTSSGSQYSSMGGGTWENTSAPITSIVLKPAGGTNLKQGTAYTLRGIAA